MTNVPNLIGLYSDIAKNLMSEYFEINNPPLNAFEYIVLVNFEDSDDFIPVTKGEIFFLLLATWK